MVDGPEQILHNPKQVLPLGASLAVAQPGSLSPPRSVEKRNVLRTCAIRPAKRRHFGIA
jgi:hypothetical protein